MFCTFLFLVFVTARTDAQGLLPCYGDLGCFDNGPPFLSEYRNISLLPQGPAEIETHYVLFTRTETAGVTISATDFSSLESSDFNASRPTKIIVHCWIETTLKEEYFAMRDALLEEGDYNVFLVDWKKGALQVYAQATANTRVVGAQIAKLIQYLKDIKGAKVEEFHVIGHGLGGQVAGYAGARTPGLGRITALDPTEPYFQYTDPVVRLDPTDADFVDVIHTDAANFYEAHAGFGMSQAAGHADFYPNGGMEQPGCEGDPPLLTSDILNDIIVNRLSCNHARSVSLFTDTIKASQCPYRAYQCDNVDDFNNGACIVCTGTGCGIAGFRADQVKPAAGVTNVKYFFNTGETAPYCRFHYKVTLIFHSSSGSEERGTLHVDLIGSAASTGMVQLTEESIYIYPGQAYTYVVTSATDLGIVEKVTFQWMKYVFLDPNTFFVLNNPAVYLHTVDVYSGEAQNGVSFCAGDIMVESGIAVTVGQIC